MVLRIFLGLSVIVFAVSGWAMSQTWQTHCASLNVQAGETQLDCDAKALRTEGYYLAAVWGCLLVFEIAIFGSTLYRVLTVRERWAGGLFALMLRDGALYFGVLLVCQLANIIVCMLAAPAYKDPVVTITTVISTSLIARLMLNIRDPGLRTGHIHLTSNDTYEV
ncbi:hypothetical protein K466DRAFT_603727 [Polyporus arcularius HHB13444]|uniref:TRP C-terminal domain-containing protein n=1 Tax=Polyporus arcularius HHB13444 TaxID=1314778 RepID=A0A5C3P066_9APHY|nr:hypothetical protein K466DRAFT_603727 [Polyporus arcularius HHB13444]